MVSASSSKRFAIRSTSGLSASILERENAFPTRERSLVCLGGSESRRLSECSQLNSFHWLSGSLGVKILPRVFVLRTALASTCLAARNIPTSSCQTGLPNCLSSFRAGYGFSTNAGSEKLIMEQGYARGKELLTDFGKSLLSRHQCNCEYYEESGNNQNPLDHVRDSALSSRIKERVRVIVNQKASDYVESQPG